ncbi:MAG: hypothetical protein WC763_03475 [Candidatus Paceibacterota bacterium]|jgi:hypothetical protein
MKLVPEKYNPFLILCDRLGLGQKWKKFLSFTILVAVADIGVYYIVGETDSQQIAALILLSPLNVRWVKLCIKMFWCRICGRLKPGEAARVDAEGEVCASCMKREALAEAARGHVKIVTVETRHKCVAVDVPVPVAPFDHPKMRTEPPKKPRPRPEDLKKPVVSA